MLTYFLFLRWLLKINVYMFLIVMTFITAPYVIWPVSSVGVANDTTASTNYGHVTPSVNSSYSAFDGCIDVMDRGTVIGNDSLVLDSLRLLSGSVSVSRYTQSHHPNIPLR